MNQQMVETFLTVSLILSIGLTFFVLVYAKIDWLLLAFKGS